MVVIRWPTEDEQQATRTAEMAEYAGRMWPRLADELSDGDREQAALVLAASAGPGEARANAAYIIHRVLYDRGPNGTRRYLHTLTSVGDLDAEAVILARIASVIDPARCTTQTRTLWARRRRAQLGLPARPPANRRRRGRR